MNTKSLHTISIWQVIDMPKRKMVQNNLLKNSISAYFAAIEIHNKPNFSYRYETVTLLIMNAWGISSPSARISWFGSLWVCVE